MKSKIKTKYYDQNTVSKSLYISAECQLDTFTRPRENRLWQTDRRVSDRIPATFSIFLNQILLFFDQ